MQPTAYTRFIFVFIILCDDENEPDEGPFRGEDPAKTDEIEPDEGPFFPKEK